MVRAQGRRWGRICLHRNGSNIGELRPRGYRRAHQSSVRQATRVESPPGQGNRPRGLSLLRASAAPILSAFHSSRHSWNRHRVVETPELRMPELPYIALDRPASAWVIRDRDRTGRAAPLPGANSTPTVPPAGPRLLDMVRSVRSRVSSSTQNQALSAQAVTRYAIRSRPTCSRGATTFERSRSCWATGT